MADKKEAEKPDFKNGVALRDFADRAMIGGTVDGESAILARKGENFFAVGAECTHYHGPLAEGLIVGDTVRCPWHHACFSLRTGEALRAPALDPISCWRVELVGGKVFAREKLSPPAAKTPVAHPGAVVIVGGGAAGLAAADMLRREGYDGPLTLISADESAPYDRPNLSKDYLAGNAQDDWIPLRPADYYKEKKINLMLGSPARAINTKAKRVQLTNGQSCEYDALLLATGAEPIKLPINGADSAKVHYLRSFADSKAIIGEAGSAKSAVVVGASFIGLEVAASLRTRGLKVDVVAPEKQPLERVMGGQIGGLVRSVHESHGVTFHLGETIARVDGREVTTSGGSTINADFIVVGAGVRPALTLAEDAGLALDRGITVDEYLETSVPGIFAAGDSARWPDPHSGEPIRVEHWVVAERQGQTAARNILGRREKFDAVPFFWSQHYDLVINYVGHAEKWDAIKVDGNLEAKDCAVSFIKQGRTLAVATISRDLKSLQVEAAMEAGQR